MSTAWVFYTTTLLVYLGVDIIAVWALNLEFGVAGVIDTAFIVMQAAGAYTAAVLTLGSESGNSGFQRYIVGLHLPFPLPILCAACVGAALASVLGLIGLRRLRGDYLAMVMLVISIIATTVVQNDVGLFNGSAGLSLVPKPLESVTGLSLIGYSWFYVALTAVVCLFVYYPIYRITRSPLGRSMRSVRENEAAAAALGRSPAVMKLTAYVVGGAVAAVSGALLVQFIGAWSPAAWLYPETFVYFTAIIIGGRGNNLGVMLGALVVNVLIQEGTRFLPQFGPPGFIDAAQWVLIGALSLLFLWFWPRGIVPERRRKFKVSASHSVLTDHSGLLPTDVSPVGARLESDDGIVDRTTTAESRTVESTEPESPRGELLLAVRDLRRDFGGVHAVDGVSFDVLSGRVTGLVGPNGSGKSTILGLIAGSLRATAGEVLLDGKPISGLPPHQIARRGVIRTFQLSSEFHGMTVLENLVAGSRIQHGESLRDVLAPRQQWRLGEERAVEKARALLERLQLKEKENELAGRLSGGERRLVELMRALMANPRVLLLDEPMAGVNRRLTARIESMLAECRTNGLTIVLVEHDLGAIERVCDHVIVLSQGSVLSEGDWSELRERQEVQDAYLVG